MQIARENVLEKLLVTGRLREEIDVLGQKMTLQVLDSGEQKDVYEVTSALDPVARLRAIQHETLARAIIAVNGSQVSYIPKEEGETVSPNKLVQQNLETLRRTPHPVVETIYAEYDKLVEKQNSQIDEIKKKLQKTGRETSGKSPNESE
jgi:hypothetical protein